MTTKTRNGKEKNILGHTVMMKHLSIIGKKALVAGYWLKKVQYIKE